MGSGCASLGRAPATTAAVAFREPVMSLVSMTASVEPAAVAPAPSSASIAHAGSGRLLRPALGLLLPVAVAVSWELAVRHGFASGRLVPPPSVIFQTFADLARTGELELHAGATLSRVIAGFAFGVVAGTVLGAITGYSALTNRLVDPTLQALRHSLDRLGAAVHSLVRHLRGLEDHPDRRGRVLSGLSRSHGRGDVGRSQDRRGRPRLPVVGDRHGAPYPVAGGDAGLRHLAARGHGAGLD